MTFALTNKKTKKTYGNLRSICFILKLNYKLSNGYSVEMLSYFPDFEFDEEGKPSTKSPIPNNPAFIFKMNTPDKPEGEVSFVAIQQTLSQMVKINIKWHLKVLKRKMCQV